MTFDEKSKNILRGLVELADKTKKTEAVDSLDGSGRIETKKVCIHIPLVVIEEIRANLSEDVK